MDETPRAIARSTDDLPERVDHTVLGPATTPEAVDRAVETADRIGSNACVPPCYVDRAVAGLDDGAVVTVVGFPHGQYARDSVVTEAEAATAAGADELDAVVNVGRIRAGDTAARKAVREDLTAVVEATPLPVKAIVCAPLLDRGELESACELAADAGCSHVKTATGFNGDGAAIEDVEVMAEYLPVKASGGIGSWREAAAMLEAGATRIGASSGGAIVEEWREAREESV